MAKTLTIQNRVSCHLAESPVRFKEHAVHTQTEPLDLAVICKPGQFSVLELVVIVEKSEFGSFDLGADRMTDDQGRLQNGSRYDEGVRGGDR